MSLLMLWNAFPIPFINIQPTKKKTPHITPFYMEIMQTIQLMPMQKMKLFILTNKMAHRLTVTRSLKIKDVAPVTPTQCHAIESCTRPTLIITINSTVGIVPVTIEDSTASDQM